MWTSRKAARIAADIKSLAGSNELSRRIETTAAGPLGEIVAQFNAVVAAAERREGELRRQIAELTDSLEDAQTAQQLSRRLKNELRARSAERDAALKRAETANEAKSAFLANMSHEVRTPLHGVMGLADALSRTELKARQQALVQSILRTGRGLLGIVNDVLDVAKIESGTIGLAPRPFNLSSFADEVVAPHLPRFERKGVELIVRVDPDLPEMLVGDSIRIRQVLSNLVDNGLKFTDEGYVLLDIDGECSGNEAHLLITVQDSGIGIPKDKLELIFEKFAQIEATSVRRHDGTGLGLSIARSLVECMGGSISVTSTPGKGSMFTVELKLPVHDIAAVGPGRKKEQASSPDRDVASSAPVEASASPLDGNVVEIKGGPFRRSHVLLVEDNPVNQEVAREYLSQIGCDVTLASNGREAIAQYCTHDFDIVLMDCRMPELDGFEATRAIREIERRLARQARPVLALTANAFGSDREACVAAGMDDHLSKPFELHELEAKFSKWLPAFHRAAAGMPTIGAAAQS